MSWAHALKTPSINYHSDDHHNNIHCYACDHYNREPRADNHSVYG